MFTLSCSKSPPRLLQVGDRVLHLPGIEDIMEHFYLEGWSPNDAALEEALVEALTEAGNHIPRGCEVECGRVLRKMSSKDRVPVRQLRDWHHGCLLNNQGGSDL